MGFNSDLEERANWIPNVEVQKERVEGLEVCVRLNCILSQGDDGERLVTMTFESSSTTDMSFARPQLWHRPFRSCALESATVAMLSPERLVRQLSGHRLPQTEQQLPRHR